VIKNSRNNSAYNSVNPKENAASRRRKYAANIHVITRSTAKIHFNAFSVKSFVRRAIGRESGTRSITVIGLAMVGKSKHIFSILH